MSNFTDAKFWSAVFNSPIESGLRAVCILTEAYPSEFDLQRILYYDYLVVHSSDIQDEFADAPPSIHPPTPNRASELTVRRELCQIGLRLMISRGLVACRFDKSGISYFATELALPFLDSLTSSYTSDLRDVARWLGQAFSDYSDSDLSGLIQANLGRWGAEFVMQSTVNEEGLSS
ncbi:MAG: ABC-three component system middle component 2 [Planctomycetota bacterium]